MAMAFGPLLQDVRKRRGWKQVAFAEAMGVSRTTVSNIECGRQRIFLDQVYRAAAILAVPVSDLLPPVALGPRELFVHTAADQPLSRSATRSVAEAVAQEMAGPRTATNREE
jgi:transcriptional regulator with XRE-family HTH domain